ncbi:hypothetical protein [Actinacidiphila oryziradicis]|uniref:Uncharacterized protein n=1 Tax=Actinacidiphila oryziradicis TaxID=2571141 RepID=A0A4U0SRP3_9ACTN|nr:hypothetical protein [Actinacidiphila oryziradicis]TKA03065.1 hypothetical protein FCI23_37610 [Actinacidiphila oryziradicis]
MTTVPDGHVRDTLRLLADTASLDDFHAAWQTAQETRDWALGLCERLEAELDAGQLGDAFSEWTSGRWMLAGIYVMDVLRDRRWSPADHANSTLPLLLMRQALRAADEQIPGCQWDLLDQPGMLPPPFKPLLGITTAPNPAAADVAEGPGRAG